MCLRCEDLDRLVFLPSADGALTRRARKASSHAVVVDWWNTQRPQRFGPDCRERLGVLVELRALEQAARQCLDDPAALAERRARDERGNAKGATRWEEVAIAIQRRFPGCPRIEVIGYYAALWPSARAAIDLVVADSARHVDTDYDELLAAGVDRAEAVTRVAGRVAALIEDWRAGVVGLDG